MRNMNCGVVVATLIASIFAIGAHAAPILTGEAFSPVLWGSSLSSSQFVEYSVTVNSSGGASDQGFLNVVRDDGTWVVQNMAVGYEPGARTMATNIDAALFMSGASYKTSFDFTPQAVAPGYDIGSARGLSAPVTYLGNNDAGRDGKGIFLSPGLPSALSLTFGPVAGFSYHTGVPDLAQGANECGPTSAANSLSWLNDKYSLGLDLSTSDIRDVLKDGSHMKTSPASGTTDSDFISGKNTFVDEKSLPITTHIIGGGAGGPSIKNILEEMKRGQDVELAMSWGSGGGHWVTLVGIFDLGPFGAGIAFNDPDDGKDQTNWSWLDGDNGFSIRSYGVDNTVDFAVAESIVPAPSTLSLSALAALACLALNRRKKMPLAAV